MLDKLSLGGLQVICTGFSLPGFLSMIREAIFFIRFVSG